MSGDIFHETEIFLPEINHTMHE